MSVSAPLSGERKLEHALPHCGTSEHKLDHCSHRDAQWQRHFVFTLHGWLRAKSSTAALRSEEKVGFTRIIIL